MLEHLMPSWIIVEKRFMFHVQKDTKVAGNSLKTAGFFV